MRNSTRSSTRVLCLHGWLDNRASFLPLMPHMSEFECVAVDLAGHGQSAHRDIHSLYHYIENVRDIKLIIDALGWERCHLIGHSMGGTLGLIAASAFPETIESLIMIDALHPMSRKAEDGPAMLRRSLGQFRNWHPQRKKFFPNIESAVKARLTASRFGEQARDARLIMRYATQETEQGLRLRNDARLHYFSPIMLSKTQVEGFIQAVEQPVLAILGTKGIKTFYHEMDKTLALFQHLSIEFIEGGHHVHMEQAERVSNECTSFIQALLLSSKPISN